MTDTTAAALPAELECPECGSEDVCREQLTPHEQGYVCDRCGHEWDIKTAQADAPEGNR